jgi:hypothetical protein
MARFTKMNNERSEAIELIKLMDSVASRNIWQIKSVGGESTLNTGQQRMFPDVFVYGDRARTQVLQGWEVKMPDVPVTDSDFIRDAWWKADVLGVRSCVIWNFTFGVLYVKKTGGWSVAREGDRTSHIKTRADVVTYKADWESLITDILCELNSFFQTGELRPVIIRSVLRIDNKITYKPYSASIVASVFHLYTGMFHLHICGIMQIAVADIYPVEIAICESFYFRIQI